MNHTLYCDLQTFSRSYQKVHGPLSLFVCFFGSIANILNIRVLTSREMRGPTNLILTGLAVSDLLVMLEYIPFSYNNYIDVEKKTFCSHFTYESAVFTKFHAIYSQMFHFTSCCLTIVLAIWRYLAIKNPNSGKYWCEWRKTLIVITITYLVCPSICCPLFFSYNISSLSVKCDVNGRIIDNDVSSSDEINREIIYITNYVENYKALSFCIYSVVIKLVPCLLLTHLSIRLIILLFETKKRRKMLMTPDIHLQIIRQGEPIINRRMDKDKQADRTSAMLVAVLILFLLTEFPQAILGFLSATKGEQFESECYVMLGK